MPAYDKLAFFFGFCQYFSSGTIFVLKAIQLKNSLTKIHLKNGTKH
jgi:hypothetical protein